MKIAMIAIVGVLAVGAAFAQQRVPSGRQRAGAGVDDEQNGAPAVVIPGPQLPYTPILGTLQWPADSDLVEMSTPGVANTKDGTIIVFHRPEAGRAPLLVFDRNGKFLRAIGKDYGVTRSHGPRVDAHDNVWITDTNLQQVIKLDLYGKVLMTLGTRQAGKSSTDVYVYGDSSKPGLYIIRLTFPPGVMSLPHSHPDTRIGTVIKGTWTGTGDKFDPASAVVPTGGVMIHPAGFVHYDGARGEETIVQMMGIGPSGKMAKPGDPGFSKQ